MSEDIKNPPIGGEPLGPQAAAKTVLEVDAQPVPPGEASTTNGQVERKLPPDQEWRATLELSLGLATSLLAKKWKAFETTKEEINAVVEAWVPVCVKYWPQGIPIEMVAGVTTVFVFGPKIMDAIKEEKSNRVAKTMAAKATAPGERGTHVAS